MILAVTNEIFDIIYKLPLVTEEQLENFEKNLLDNNIKNKMVK